MPVLRLRTLLVLVVATALTVLLSACGSTIFPTPTPTAFSEVTPASGTPTAQLTGLAAQGQQLFVKYQCAICHSLTGQRIVGPPLNGLYGSTVPLTNGTSVKADDAYLKLAILEPDAQVVNGYQSGIMSSHIGQFETEIAQANNLDALVAFIQSQK